MLKGPLARPVPWEAGRRGRNDGGVVTPGLGRALGHMLRGTFVLWRVVRVGLWERLCGITQNFSSNTSEQAGLVFEEGACSWKPRAVGSVGARGRRWARATLDDTQVNASWSWGPGVWVFNLTLLSAF